MNSTESINKYSTNHIVTNNISTDNNSPIDKKLLVENIKTLSKSECLIIFNLIRKDTDKYTENNNGIFFNSNNIKQNTLELIDNYVNKIISNKQQYNNKSLIVESDTNYNISEYSSPLQLSNYEKSIVKRTNYINEQKKFKNNNWFVKKKI